MKRDMELIRKMVLKMVDDPRGYAPNFEIEGYSDDQIGYHAYLLHDSGLAVGLDATSTSNSGPYYMLQHLTSAGHDFAENARNQFVWDEVMAGINERGIRTTSLDILKKLLDKALRKRLDGE
jgi:hypothetical protein